MRSVTLRGYAPFFEGVKIMNEIIEKENIKIEKLIYEIRGKQVMLDSDLAMLYRCANGTKTINQAVSRHLDRFPKDFYFQLTSNEYNFLRSQIGTLEKGRGQHKKYLPFVFTEQGVAMLSAVLRTEVASQVSVSIMRAFVVMRHYIGNSNYRLSNVESKVIELDKDVKLLQESFKKLDEKKRENEIYFNGQIYDAYSKIIEIFKNAKNKLIIIDGYADNTILDIIKRLKTKVIIITKSNNLLTKQDILKYNKQYHNLEVIYNNTFHDRYFILDDKEFYHCGASINRIGYKTFSITKMEDVYIYNSLLNKVNEIIKNN